MAKRPGANNADSERMTRSRFAFLVKKRFNPAYFIRIEADEIPTITIRRYSCLVGAGEDPKLPVIRSVRALVLSKGPADANRRVVAEDSGLWVEQLWVCALLRQLRHGTLEVKAWCYETLSDIESDGPMASFVSGWIRDFSLKEEPC